MAKPLTNTAGGKTSRKLLLLALVAGIVGAILVYAALSRGSDSTGGAGGVAAPTVPVVVAGIDIPARTKISDGMLEIRQVAPDSRGELAFTDLSEVVGRVSRYPIATGEHVLSTKVVALGSAAEASDSLSYVIPEGKRAISIGVSEVVSSGGLVLPGDYVDIIGVFDVDFRDGDDERTEERYFARVILQNIEVLAVAQTVVDTPPEAGATTGADGEAVATEIETADGQRVRNTEADPDPKAVTTTLSVTSQEAQLLFLAEENGVLRLAVRPYGDAEVEDIPFVVENELIPSNLPDPFWRR